MSLRTLIVLPTYNERDNIAPLIAALLAVDEGATVCVVDDSSPDGTSAVVADEVAARAAWKDRVHLITRRKKDGRGGAVRDGFAWGVGPGGGFDAYVEMDCDFSHEPTAVPEGLRLLREGWDVAIGARYPSGVIIGWPRSRRLFSAMANRLARTLIDGHIADYTTGFRFYAPRAVSILLSRPQRHKGYIYLSESVAYLLRAGCRVTSFPITFRNRERGVSNTGIREVAAALWGIVTIAVDYRRPSP